MWHHFPGCFSKQTEGGECSALVLSLASMLTAGDEEKRPQGMGRGTPVTSGEYLCKEESSRINARSRGNRWMMFYCWQPKALAVGLLPGFPWVSTKTRWWEEDFCCAWEKDQHLMPEGRKRLLQISGVLSLWLCSTVPPSLSLHFFWLLQDYWSTIIWEVTGERCACILQ